MKRKFELALALAVIIILGAFIVSISTSQSRENQWDNKNTRVLCGRQEVFEHSHAPCYKGYRGRMPTSTP